MPGDAFVEIKGATGGVYRPTADDVGARVCLRACLPPQHGLGPAQRRHTNDEKGDDALSVFREVGPFALGNATAARLQASLSSSPKGVTFAGLREPRNPHQVYDLVLAPSGVELWARPAASAAAAASSSPSPTAEENGGNDGDDTSKGEGSGVQPQEQHLHQQEQDEDARALVGQKARSLSFSSSSSSSSTNEDGDEEDEEERGSGRELVGRGTYSRQTLVAIHPASPTLLVVQLPLFLVGEGGSPSGTSPALGEEVLLVRTLHPASSDDRDVLALLWRAWRRAALQAAGGRAASEDEFVDDSVLLLEGEFTRGKETVAHVGLMMHPGWMDGCVHALLMPTAHLSWVPVLCACYTVLEDTEEGNDAAEQEEEPSAAVEQGPAADSRAVIRSLVPSQSLSDSENGEDEEEEGEGMPGPEPEPSPGAADDDREAKIARLTQQLAEATAQLERERAERTQQQSQQPQTEAEEDRSRPTGNSSGGGFGGLGLLRRRSSWDGGGAGEERETVKALKKEVEALHAKMAQLELALDKATREAVSD